METASNPTLIALRFCGNASSTRTTTTDAANTAKLFCHISGDRSLIAYPRKHHRYSLSRKFSISPRSDCFTSHASINNAEINPSQKFALVLEVEGVLMDVHPSDNRESFNVAFKKLGLDCANWTEPIYVDLVRKSAGDEERMLTLYFNRIGWPTSVATSEKGTFMKNVLRAKKNASNDLVVSKDFSLRPGAEEFIADACNEGIPVVILTAYGTSGENVARSIAEKLGTEIMSKTKIVGYEAASFERHKIAEEEVASMLKLKVEPSNNSGESLQNIVAALRAGAEYAALPIYKCVLVAGSQSGAAAAAASQIGMPCIVFRSSSTSRAEFDSAIAVMDGFGGPDLTISRLCRKLSS